MLPGMDAVAAEHGAPAAVPASLPPLDLGRLTVIVDPRHECSTAQQARGPYTAQLIPALSAPELTSALPAASCRGPGGPGGGLEGVPGRAPSPDTYAALLSGQATGGPCTGLLFLGVGRFAAHVPPAVLASAPLGGCEAALLFDRCNTDEAYWAQLYRDNRKSAEQRRLESPSHVATLLLRTVLVMSAAAPPAAVVKLMHGVMAGLAAGRPLGEVVYSLLSGGGGGSGAGGAGGVLDEFELAAWRT
ncbi:hypothetical protein HXX76_000925 [Chlamydomonas incerta]|uniref:Uncharacterized protein n=1 Tax=Chlamydomonas incerta TaxID=51695 RepID=A0A835WF61_CHLIN|nr:hypothetical protein HXX76_000925 [Chlamydomonas incerta]|eukprot:KAG2446337.1 hypothetical protein HXX76_000925 [Chlamydomonas incerta]